MLSSSDTSDTGTSHQAPEPPKRPWASSWTHYLKFFEARDLIEAIMTGTPAWPDFREGWEVEKVIDAVDAASSSNSWVAIR